MAALEVAAPNFGPTVLLAIFPLLLRHISHDSFTALLSPKKGELTVHKIISVILAVPHHIPQRQNHLQEADIKQTLC